VIFGLFAEFPTFQGLNGRIGVASRDCNKLASDPSVNLVNADNLSEA
jgi:hypothetical protein